MRGTLEERFWAKVNKNGPIPEHRPELGQCWVWLASCNPAGYGYFRMGQSTHLAHRASWEIHNGPAPDSLFVCHHCDNPPCVRPTHFFLGTDGDNTRDAVLKGLMHRGERTGSAKLTEEMVRTIRERYHTGNITQATIARQYNIDPSNVSYILARKTWRHI